MQSTHISLHLYASRILLIFTMNFLQSEQKSEKSEKSEFAIVWSDCLFLTHSSFLVSWCKPVTTEIWNSVQNKILYTAGNVLWLTSDNFKNVITFSKWSGFWLLLLDSGMSTILECVSPVCTTRNRRDAQLACGEQSQRSVCLMLGHGPGFLCVFLSLPIALLYQCQELGHSSSLGKHQFIKWGI